MLRSLRPVLALFALAVAAASPTPSWGEAAVTGVRIGEHPDKTRFVLDLTEQVDYRIFTLPDPYRVIVDLPEVAWNLPSQGRGQGDGIIDSYRYGLFRPGVSRVVLDLRAPVEVTKSFFLEPAEGYGYRFVLDLKRTGRRAFLAALESAPPPLPPLQPATNGLARPGPANGVAKPVIVIDAGHGGVDPGTIGANGTVEKHITLAFARQLKRRLEATGRYHAVLTRDRDIFLRLRERVSAARAAGGDLFLSLHADSIENSRVRGVSVYTLSEVASDKEAEALAAKENKADLIAGMDLTHENPEVANILIDLAQRESMNLSARFANLVLRELRGEARLLRNSHRFAGFAVLKAPDVPSVLIELGYLSNPREERLLRSAEYQTRLSDGIAHAIDRYFAWKEALNRP